MIARALLCALVLASCRLDVGQPIALIPAADLSERDIEVLGEAAQCWNESFGTQLQVGEDLGFGQEVDVISAEAVCLFASGLYESGLSNTVALCPFFDQVDQFLVATHELGHALNIRTHPPGSAIMAASYEDASNLDGFTAADRRSFAAANPEFAPSASDCGAAMDSTGRTMSRALGFDDHLCRCAGARRDTNRPFELVTEASARELVDAAANCWNLAFGAQIEVVDQATAGSQSARVIDSCSAILTNDRRPTMPVCVEGRWPYQPLNLRIAINALGFLLNLDDVAIQYRSASATWRRPEKTDGEPPFVFDAGTIALFEAANPDHERAGCRVVIDDGGQCVCAE